MDGFAQPVQRQLVFVHPKRVFDFFRDELHADEDVKDQHHHRHAPPRKRRHEADGQGDHVEEDEFLEEHAVAVRNGRFEDAFAGTEDVDHALEVLGDEPVLLFRELASLQHGVCVAFHALRPGVGNVRGSSEFGGGGRCGIAELTRPQVVAEGFDKSGN